MPRVTHVRAAQQRYERIPVLDEATGQPKVVPVNRTTKRGTAVTMIVTRNDPDQPLPPYTCGYCRQPIAIGTPYKRMSPKSGPYGGRTLRRHESCPPWQQWDYSNSLSAQLARIGHDFLNAIGDATDPSEVESALGEAAEAIREIAEAKRESAQNIEEGFQHSTGQSEELAQIADDLDAWADEIEAVSVPDLPEPEEEDCGDCDGDDPECETCKGASPYTPEEPTESQMDEWHGEVESETGIVGQPPV